MPYVDSTENLPAIGSGADIAVGNDGNGDQYDLPTHDISLEDAGYEDGGAGTRRIGLVLCNSQGVPLPESFSVAPYPKMASKIREGRGGYDDSIGPFSDEALEMFSGGRGIKYRDKKSDGYYEGFKADTRKKGAVYVGPAEKYIPGIRHYEENWYNDKGDTYKWYATEGNEFIVEFTTTAAFNMTEIQILMKRKGEIPTAPTLAWTLRIKGGADVASASMTSPYTVNVHDAIKENQGNTDGQFGDDYNMKLIVIGAEFLDNPNTTIALTDATTYELVLAANGNADADNCYEILCDQSDNPYYRVLDDTGDFECIYIEYLGGLYCITQPADKTASKLYLLGYRGLADDNSGDKSLLNDSGASWVVDELIDGYAMVVGGPGSEEDKPFRLITDNTGTTATVDEDWIVTHTTDTMYYLMYDHWKLIKTFSYYVTDAKVAGRVIHLAFGKNQNHRWLRYGNQDGVWTEEYAAAPAYGWKADKFLPIQNTGYKSRRRMYDIYIAQNNEYGAGGNSDMYYPNNLMQMTTAPYFGTPLMILGLLEDTTPWHDASPQHEPGALNVDVYPDRGYMAIDVAEPFGTGSLASRKWATARDMSKAEMIGFGLKSSIDLAAGDLQLEFVDGLDAWLVDFPAITAEDDMHDEFRWYVVKLQEPESPKVGDDFARFDGIIELEIKSTVDKGAYKLKFAEPGFVLLTRNLNNNRYEFDEREKINNLLEFGGGSGQASKKPWIITNQWFYYIENGELKPLYLQELKKFKHYKNGLAACVWDVYLVANVGHTVQRFYQGRLDSIGPDKSDFSPEKIPSSLVAWGGHLFGSFGNRIMVRRNSVWHEYWNGGMQAGVDPDHGLSWREYDTVNSLYILGMEDEPDKLFFNRGADVGYVQLVLNPQEHIQTSSAGSKYKFGPEAVIRTSVITSNKREIEKYYHAVRIVQQNLNVNGGKGSGVGYVEIAYRTSEDDTPDVGWNSVEDHFEDTPKERHQLTTDYDVKGTHIELEIRINNYSNNISPVLQAVILENLEREIVNFSRQLQCRLYAGNDIDKQNKHDDQTGEQKWAQLKTWMNSPLPVKMKTNSKFVPETYLFIEPVISTPVIIRRDAKDNEMYICPFSVTEVHDE